MLEASFIHLPAVGPRTEGRLWQAGIDNWQAALDADSAPGISLCRWETLQREIRESSLSLTLGEYRYFARRLARRYHWRAWPDFRHRTAYLDIETTGLEQWSQITVVGVYDGVYVHSFVHGDNLDQLPEFLEQFSMLVTFNGATFDLPFLRRRFRELPLDQLHIDLRYALRELGLRGGLKSIEQRLGLAREGDLAGLDGFDAVRLWEEYCAGSESALDLLCRYNAADVVSLEILAEHAYRELWRRCRGDCPVTV